jgi:hypothetical protein
MIKAFGGEFRTNFLEIVSLDLKIIEISSGWSQNIDFHDTVL